MPTFTPNLNLKKPLQTENYNVDDFNGNCDLIDTKIKSIDDNITSLTVNKTDNSWKPLTLYFVGDIIYSSKKIDSYKIMECTISGTTGNSEPTWSAVGTVTIDGTASFKVFDIRQGNIINRLLTVVDVGAGIAGYPAIDGSLITKITSSKLNGALPAIDGSLLTNIVSSGAGWVKFSDGTMIQSGATTTMLANTYQDITYPITFFSTPMTIITPAATAPNISSFGLGINLLSSSSLCRVYTLGNVTIASSPWVSIGRWKA